MKRTILLLTAAFLVSGEALAMPDKFGITPEEHTACDADAINLCAATYPDEDKLLACMKANRHQLSPVCLTAFISGLRRRRMPL